MSDPIRFLKDNQVEIGNQTYNLSQLVVNKEGRNFVKIKNGTEICKIKDLVNALKIAMEDNKNSIPTNELQEIYKQIQTLRENKTSSFIGDIVNFLFNRQEALDKLGKNLRIKAAMEEFKFITDLEPELAKNVPQIMGEFLKNREIHDYRPFQKNLVEKHGTLQQAFASKIQEINNEIERIENISSANYIVEKKIGWENLKNSIESSDEYKFISKYEACINNSMDITLQTGETEKRVEIFKFITERIFDVTIKQEDQLCTLMHDVTARRSAL